MPPSSITINARYFPPPPTNEPVMPTYIARYELLHAPRRDNRYTFVRTDAEALERAVRSWKHDTNFFASVRGYKLFNDFRQSWSILLMNKKATTKYTDNRPEWKGFLERGFTDAELEECDGWKPKPAEVWEYVMGITESQVDISLSYSPKTKMITVTLKDQRPDSPTAGYALSSKGDDAMDALKLSIWKHTKLLLGDWSTLLQAAPKSRRG